MSRLSRWAPRGSFRDSGRSSYKTLDPDLEDEDEEILKRVATKKMAIALASKWTPTREEIDQFPDHVARMRRHMDFLNAGVNLHPKGRLMGYWDIVVLSGLAFCIIVTPFEVALLETSLNALFFINQVVSLLFVCDIVINFNLPFEAFNERNGYTELIRDPWLVASNYARGWLAIDVMSVLPFDWLIVFKVFGDSSNPNSGFDPVVLRLSRQMRLLRLLKLLRVLRASRIFRRWEARISMRFSTRDIVFWIAFQMIVVHWYSCAWCLQAKFTGAGRDLLPAGFEEAFELRVAEDPASCTGCVKTGDLALETLMFCLDDCLTRCEMDVALELKIESMPYASAEMLSNQMAAQQSWMCRAAELGLVDRASSLDLYAYPLSSNGMVDPTHSSEYIFFYILSFIQTVINALFIAVLSGVFATADPHGIVFKQKMDDLNTFFSENSINETLCTRVREFMINSRERYKRRAQEALLERLSDGLRGEVLGVMESRIFASIGYLNGYEKGFLPTLMSKLTHEGFAPRDKVNVTNALCIVKAGIAGRDGSMLNKGQTWGEDFILTSLHLQYRGEVVALTYLEVMVLQRVHLDETLLLFPEARKGIRQAAVLLAIRRCAIALSKDKEHITQSSSVIARARKRRTSVLARGEIEDRKQGRTVKELLNEEALQKMNGGLPVKRIVTDPTTGTRRITDRYLSEHNEVTIETLSKELKDLQRGQTALCENVGAIKAVVSEVRSDLQSSVISLAAMLADGEKPEVKSAAAPTDAPATESPPRSPRPSPRSPRLFSRTLSMRRPRGNGGIDSREGGGDVGDGGGNGDVGAGGGEETTWFGGRV